MFLFYNKIFGRDILVILIKELNDLSWFRDKESLKYLC